MGDVSVKTRGIVAVGAESPENSAKLQGPFYLVDIPINNALTVLEELLQKPIIMSANIPAVKLSFTSKKQIPASEVIKIMRSLLMLNGVAIIPVDGKYYKAVPASGVSTQIPEFLIGRANDMPASQIFYTKFFELENIQVSDIEGKLKSSMSQNNVGSFEAFPKCNSFWVTDTLLNLQRIEDLVEKLDVPTTDVFVMQISNAAASDIKDRITALHLDTLKNAALNADARTNKLIVCAPRSTIPQIKKLVSELDVESVALLKSEVIYIKHGEAAKVVDVLTKIVSGQKRSKTSAPQASQPQNQQQQQKPQGGQRPPLEAENREKQHPSQALGEAETVSGKSSNDGIEFSDYVQIVAEERSNAIVVYGTTSDLLQIKSIIEKLDIVLLQVKIDVLITEVVLTNDQVSGLSTFGFNYNATDNPGFSGSTNTYKLTGSSSPAFSVTAGETNFAFLFDVARQNQNVKVLSSPTIVTTHNKEAEINISQSLPIITSSMSDITSITTTRSSVSYKDIGIRLLVTPLVGNNGDIQLKIDQSVDSISGYTTIDNNQQPIISKRKATSFVSAKSNEVITLAGLQQVDTAEMGGGVWLLSDIPLLGEIFKPAKNEYKRRELIIFIRPTVVASSSVENIINNKEINNSPVKGEIKTFWEQGKFYPNGELEKGAEDFEKNRPYNRLLNMPY